MSDKLKAASDVASYSRWLPYYRRLAYVRPGVLAIGLKHLLGVKRRIVKTKRGDFYLDPASNFGLHVLYHGEYEAEMTETLTRILKPDSVFVDVGANEGYFSIVASHLVGLRGKVLSVEPQGRLQDVIETNIKLNNVSNATLLRHAVSNCNQIVRLYLSHDVNTGTSSLTHTLKYRMAFEEVEAVTLDEFFRRYDLTYVDLLKMDIEGFEYEAILGSPDIFKQHRIGALALELHPAEIAKRNLDATEINRFLQSCGYEIDKRFSNLVYVARKRG